MAKKAESYKLNEKKKEIIIYTNVEASKAEIEAREFYMKNGYTVKFEEKKPPKTVAEMKKELSVDEEALKKFQELYDTKGGEKPGFFLACKFYADWKKEQKKKNK